MPHLPVAARLPRLQARAGADCVSPSDMMDGRVSAIRQALDSEGFTNGGCCCRGGEGGGGVLQNRTSGLGGRISQRSPACCKATRFPAPLLRCASVHHGLHRQVRLRLLRTLPVSPVSSRTGLGMWSRAARVHQKQRRGAERCPPPGQGTAWRGISSEGVHRHTLSTLACSDQPPDRNTSPLCPARPPAAMRWRLCPRPARHTAASPPTRRPTSRTPPTSGRWVLALEEQRPRLSAQRACHQRCRPGGARRQRRLVL